MWRKKQESLQPEHLVFDVLTDPGSQPSPIHNDVADTHVEELPGDDEQSTLFAGAKPVRRVVTAKKVSSDWVDVSGLTQAGMFGYGSVEMGIPETFEDCFVESKPSVRTEDGKKVWLCIFSTPPDLWHQEKRWVHARTTDLNFMEEIKKEKLRLGDYANVTGIMDSNSMRPISKGENEKRVIYMKLTGVTRIIPHDSAKKKIIP